MTTEDWIGLLASLPPSWRPYVLLALSVMPFVSGGLMVAKWLYRKIYGTDIPAPKSTDPWWRKLALSVLVVLDILATNSPPILSRLKAAWSEPPRKGTPPGAAFLVLVLPVLLSCAATPLQTHAQVADGTANLIDEAGRLLERRIRLVEEDAVGASATRDEAVARIQRLRSTYAPLEAAYEAVRLAHEAYVDAILRAHAAGLGRPEPGALLTLSAAWAELAKRAEMLGLVLPEPSDALAGLLSDPGGAP
jgi:hypothetical protein